MWRLLLCVCLVGSLPFAFSSSPCSVVELTENTGAIKHPHQGNYAPDETCGWKIVPIQADESSRVVVSFTSLDLVERTERSDYIEIFDGLDELYGTPLAIITGNEIPPAIEATGRTMYIKFEATGADNETAKGFKFEYSVTKCKDDCSGNGYCFDEECHCDPGFKGSACAETTCDDLCGGDRGECAITAESQKCECLPGFYGGDCSAPRCSGVSEFTETSGNFTDRHSEGTMNYNSNTECQWIIYAPSTTPVPHHVVSFIQLHFTRFSTQFEKDWVHVYDSETAEISSLLGSFSGGVIPADLISTTGVMLVTFETDIGVEYEGFECTYEVSERSVTVTPTVAPHESKTVAFIFAALTFLFGIVLGAAFSFVYRGMGTQEEEEEEQEGGFSPLDQVESLLDSD